MGARLFLMGRMRRRWRGAARWEGAPLEGVDVEPTVAVEVEDGHAAGHGLGELVFRGGAMVETEHKAASGGLVAELLMLKDEMPRSLASCYENLVQNLDHIATDYGRRGPAQRQALTVRARLMNSRIEEIFQSGLHEFIGSFIEDNNRLGSAVAAQYLI